MLCTKCKKNNATVFYKQVINGTVKEAALCADCAAEMNIGAFKSTAQPLGGFSSPSMSGLNLISSLFGESPRSYRGVPNKVCPLCGSSYGDIAKSGKVGCAKCYETFRAELMPTVTGIHGRVKHTGRAPKEFRSRLETKKSIDALGEKLTKAIENQEFEEAAKIRDEIKKLRGEASN